MDKLKVLCTVFSSKPVMVDGDRKITYKVFFRQLEHFAGFLYRKKVDFNRPVGVYIENSPETVISMLSVTRLRGFYSIIDPSFPRERTELICKLANFSCIISTEEHREFLRMVAPNAEIFTVEEILSKPSYPYEKPEDDFSKPMVLSFTSGSTGVPKGVVQNYSYFVNGTKASKEFFRRMRLRWDCILPLGFTGSMLIFVGLFSGATTYFFDIKKHGASAYADFIKKNKINASNMTVSAFRTIASLGKMGVFGKHKGIVLVGEPVLPSDLQLFSKVAGKKTRLTVPYGSTEAVAISGFEFYKNDPIPNKIPVGTISKNVSVYILDENREELPQGEVGEIAVFSEFLAKSYYKNEEESQKTYFINKKNQSILLTGDLGYIGDDGLLYHEGRKDFMIKIRGYRADTKEVEKQLQDFPGVKEAVVVGNKKEFTVDWLVAFISTYSDVDLEMLRNKVSANLPEYMVPRKIVELQKFPLGDTGKTDRKKLIELALTDLDKLEDEEKQKRGSRKNELFNMVEAIWIDELGIKNIDPHNDFFNDLGGDSLLAAKMLTRIETEIGKKLPLSLIFRYRTLESIVEYIEGRKDKSAEVHIQKKGDPNGTAVFLIPALKGGVQSYGNLHEQFNESSWVYNVSFDIVDADNRHFISLNKMMDTLAETIINTGHQKVMVMGYSFGGLLAYEVAVRLEKKCTVIPVVIDVPPVTRNQFSFFNEFFGLLSKSFKKKEVEGDVELQKIKDNVRKRWAYLFISKHNFRIKAFEAENIQTLYSSAHVRLFKQMKHESINSDMVLICSTKNRKWGKPYSEGSRQKWEKFVKGKLHIHWVEGTHEQLFSRIKLKEIVELITPHL